MANRAEPVFRALTLLLMACMALAAIIIAAGPIRSYGELARGTLVYYATSLAGGVALLVLCVLMVLKVPSRLYKVAASGLVAAVALAANQIAGLRFSTILCFTPS